MIHQEDTQIGQVIHIEELPQRRTVAPASHLLQTGLFRLMKTTDQGRQHMGVFRMIIIIGAIQIRRHHRDVVRPILTVQILAILQSADLGQGIRLVRLLQFRSQQATLRHRLRSHTRVDTRGTQELQFLATVLPGTVNHIHLQDHIVIHKVSQSTLIGNDAPYFGSGQKHILRLLGSKKGLDLILTGQVQFSMGTCNQIRIALALQFAYDGRSDHSPVTGHIDLRLFLHHLTTPFSKYSARLVRITPAM